MPIPFFRCAVCHREFPSLEGAARCEKDHLTAVSAEIKVYGIHKYPYSIDVTFSNGETWEYTAQNMG